MPTETELLICPVRAKLWQVVQRPRGTTPVPPGQIKILASYRSRELAVAFAEGRSSATGQPVVMN